MFDVKISMDMIELRSIIFGRGIMTVMLTRLWTGVGVTTIVITSGKSVLVLTRSIYV